MVIDCLITFEPQKGLDETDAVESPPRRDMHCSRALFEVRIVRRNDILQMDERRSTCVLGAAIDKVRYFERCAPSARSHLVWDRFTVGNRTGWE